MTVARLSMGLIALLLITSGVAAQGSWTPVVGAGAAVTAGFTDVDNARVGASAVFLGQLYVATINDDTGCEIWRTGDGVTWSPSALNGFGDPDNQGVYSMAVFGGYLYAATDLLRVPGGKRSTGTRIWRTANGTAWTMVKNLSLEDSNTLEPYAMAVFDQQLWVGVANFTTGAEVWRSSDGLDWYQANIDGFGSSDNLAVSAMATAGGYVWAATYNDTTGCQVWRRNSGLLSYWSLVSSGGFGSVYNALSLAMGVLDDVVYVSTWNSNELMEVWRYVDGWERVVSGGFGVAIASYAMTTTSGTLYLGTYGSQTEIWSTHDGLSWTQLSAPSFGSPGNWATSALAAMDGYVYAGTNNSSGCQVWRSGEVLFADSFDSGTTSAWSNARN